MSSRRSAQLAILLVVALPASLGCFEQIDNGKWFPQMKRQLAVQSFEDLRSIGRKVGDYPIDRAEGLLTPEGTVPVGGASVPDLEGITLAGEDALKNPVAATLASLDRGREVYNRTCVMCHGPNGGGDGLVAGAPFGKGPFGLVLPIGGKTSVARGLSDGHIYSTISGRRGVRMPSYRRISPEDRWNVVNYVRELNR